MDFTKLLILIRRYFKIIFINLKLILIILIIIFDIVLIKNVVSYYNEGLLFTKNGHVYCFTNHYGTKIVINDFVKINGNYYFFDENGLMVKNKQITHNNKIHILDADGKLIK